MGSISSLYTREKNENSQGSYVYHAPCVVFYIIRSNTDFLFNTNNEDSFTDSAVPLDADSWARCEY